MKLSQLIDLECQVYKDQQVDPAELRRRDRAIGRSLDQKNQSAEGLILAWLERVRDNAGSSIGDRFNAGLRWTRLVLVLLGFAAGGSTAAAVLAYDGSTPVNVVHFLAIFVGLQLLMLLALLISMMPARITALIPGAGDARSLLRELFYASARAFSRLHEHNSAQSRQKLSAGLHTLQTRLKLHSKVERWFIIGLTQRFAAAFNAGALITCFYLIAFSDIAFMWNTTLNIDSTQFHQIVSTIAKPWKAAFSEGSPSIELIEISRYYRLEGEYVQSHPGSRAANAAAVGGWWRFLILALVSYGLLPRLVLLLIARLQLQRALKRVPYDAGHLQSILDRLTRPILETRALEAEDAAARSEAEVSHSLTVASGTEICCLVSWGEIGLDKLTLEKAVQKRFGWRIEAFFEAGGIDIRKDEVTCAQLAAQARKSLPIVILAESWEAPGKAVLFFLQQLRGAIDSKRHLIICLINNDNGGFARPPDPIDFQTWRRVIASIDDPYVRVEMIAEGP